MSASGMWGTMRRETWCFTTCVSRDRPSYLTSDMIHASGKNLATDGRIRLSVDLRFADGDQQWDPRWNK